MNWDEWEKEYPCRKARSLPPESCRVAEPCDTYREAESVRDFREEVDEHGGYIVVEWEVLRRLR